MFRANRRCKEQRRTVSVPQRLQRMQHVDDHWHGEQRLERTGECLEMRRLHVLFERLPAVPMFNENEQAFVLVVLVQNVHLVARLGTCGGDACGGRLLYGLFLAGLGVQERSDADIVSHNEPPH